MRILRTKTEKEINLLFSFKRVPIFDVKWAYDNGVLWSFNISLFWLDIQYTDLRNLPF
jgi:hypothetical protein